MRTRQAITISLPPKMIQTVEAVRRAEHRTRSELFREALRVYFARRDAAEVAASATELRAIRRGRAAHTRGDYVTFDQLRHEVGTPRRRTRKKGA